jgi:signal peptidase II
VDQWSKSMIRRHLSSRSLSWGRILRLRYVIHLKQSHARAGVRVALAVIWLAALASAIVLHRQGSRFETPVALLGAGLALGGAAGNLLDILRLRYVVDFIDLRWWPVFNLADVAIVGGLVVALWPR